VAVPLYGVVVSKFSRHRFLPWVYGFFILNILIFRVLFEFPEYSVWVARAFFIWLSVFNLFVVSVFWSFMSDIYTKTQANRLYGFIASGGTCGAICGPFITLSLAKSIGPVNLLLISAFLLALAIIVIRDLVNRRLLHVGDKHTLPVDIKPVGGNPFSGFRLALSTWYLLGICLFILLYTACSTFLYFAQAQIVADAFESSEDRTSLFALMDLLVNSLTLCVQVFITGKLLSRLGTAISLMILPLLVIVGFFCLSISPVLVTLMIFQVSRRTLNYGLSRPARESLFTILTLEEKYKAKNFIDTVVYRGGDALTGWVFAGLRGLGLSLPVIMVLALPLGVVWMITGLALGKHCDKAYRTSP